MKIITTKTKKIILFFLFNLLFVAVAFFLIEGLASAILLLQTVAATPPIAERSHTQYDAELGWVNLPDVYIEDMYGPQLYLKTNGQRFRNDRDFPATVSDQQLRVVCSGDSFTLGYGVDNRQPWCQQLSQLDSRLETVNMGQGGYGLDQAYLWYKRDGAQLGPDLHLFAFITVDFERMQQDNFLGYGKPVLTIRDNELAVENVPVPNGPSICPG